MSDVVWKEVKGFEDIRYEKTDDGIAKITINRPEVRNAFYLTEEGKEGKTAFLEKRKPNYKKFKRLP